MTPLVAAKRKFADLLPALALAAAMLLGGSGSLVPLPEIVLECLLAVLFGAWLWSQSDALRQVPRAAWAIAGLLIALPLLQLVPLPPAIWQALPGRVLEQAALELVDQGSTWRPLSLTVNRTVAALLVMAAAAAMLVMAAAQDRRGRTRLLATVAGIALLSVLAGAAQLSGGPASLFRFYNAEESFLDGFQTNHNAAADVLLIGMVALAATASDWAQGRSGGRRLAVDPRQVLASVGGVTLLLVLGVVLTASRTGIALLPVALGAQALIWRRSLRLGKRAGLLALAVLMAAGLIALASGHRGVIGVVVARFHTPTEFRPEIWRDSLFALRQYWPWGTGMGSFVPVYAAAERLEAVTTFFVNRAHDDYLELLIEAGLPGLLVCGAIAVQIGRSAWHSWRGGGAGQHAQLIFGGASLAIIALHSLVDYPLRTLSLACIAAVSAGLLLPSGAEVVRGNRERHRDDNTRTAHGGFAGPGLRRLRHRAAEQFAKRPGGL